MPIVNGWFSESEVMWPGQAMSLKLKDGDGLSPSSSCLLDTQTDFQHLQVFDTSEYGRMLVLDGIIQLTERDEFSYQEMLAHSALFSHSDPQRVLIIGGGDGGILREVCRHDVVREICAG